jgi:hypothetical protein
MISGCHHFEMQSPYSSSMKHSRSPSLHSTENTHDETFGNPCRGTYPEAMTAAIAAFRAGQAPHFLQVFEVGTATKMVSKDVVN